MKRAIVFSVVSLVLLSLTSMSFAESIDDLTLMTEQYPPFNFSKDGKIQGISVDLLVAMLEKTGSSLGRKDIKLLPWARGYNKVQENQNTCLFAMTRSEARENLFKWVGPIIESKIGLIARKDRNININAFDDLANYKIGVIREDIGEQLLLSNGVPRSALDDVAKAELNIKKLNADRIDMWSYDTIVAMYFIKESGLQPTDYENVFTISAAPLYYAFHNNTSDAILKKLQDALDALKKEGVYQTIVDRYSK